MKPSIFIYSVIIVVLTVILIEKGFHFLHEFTVGSPYDELLNAIEKELMVVGCTAFILKIY